MLKPSMVIPGQKSGQRASVREVAEATLEILLRYVPAAVPGCAFLSGGQSDGEATAHLNEINVLAKERHAPWALTFSYGRALQQASIAAWKGDDANIAPAQAALLKRARLNAAAALGRYAPEMEKEAELVGAR